MTVTEQGLTLRVVGYDARVAQQLVAEALADLAQRYGGEGDGTPVHPAQFALPQGIFLVAFLNGTPVGCGGWRSHGDDAEIKRMYTAPHARGRGVARAVLQALEDSARAAGRRRTILEAGSRQPEAISLYESRGYRKIPNFGFYQDAPGAVSFGLKL